MIRLGYYLIGKSAVEKAEFALEVASALMANANKFPEQSSAATELHDLAAELKQAVANKERAQAILSYAASTEAIVSKMFESCLTQVASDVEKVSAGDVAMLELAKLNLPAPPVSPVRRRM